MYACLIKKQPFSETELSGTDRLREKQDRALFNTHEILITDKTWFSLTICNSAISICKCQHVEDQRLTSLWYYIANGKNQRHIWRHGNKLVSLCSPIWPTLAINWEPRSPYSLLTDWLTGEIVISSTSIAKRETTFPTLGHVGERVMQSFDHPRVARPQRQGINSIFPFRVACLQNRVQWIRWCQNELNRFTFTYDTASGVMCAPSHITKQRS